MVVLSPFRGNGTVHPPHAGVSRMSRSGRPPTPSFSFYYVSNMPEVTWNYGAWNHVCVCCWFLATSGTIPLGFSFDHSSMHACTHAINPEARERNEGSLGNKRWGGWSTRYAWCLDPVQFSPSQVSGCISELHLLLIALADGLDRTVRNMPQVWWEDARDPGYRGPWVV